MSIEPGDEVHFEYVGRLPDGTVFDTSRKEVAEDAGILEAHEDWEYGPVKTEVGDGQLLEGLEEGLVGLNKGNTELITVFPEKGYGEPEDDLIQTYERGSFEEKLGEMEIELGMHIRTKEDGAGELVAIDSETVDIDFNHSLAGSTLEFEIDILDVS